MWEIIILVLFSIWLWSLQLGRRDMEKKQIIMQRLINSLFFALYEKKKEYVKDYLLDISDMEEAIKIINSEKYPKRDTSDEDLFKILEGDYADWKKKQHQRTSNEYLEKKELSKNIGVNIKKIREKKSISRKELSEKMNTNVDYIKSVEEGRSSAVKFDEEGNLSTSDFINEFAEALGIEADELTN